LSGMSTKINMLLPKTLLKLDRCITASATGVG
jgi:hypothetical protein